MNNERILHLPFRRQTLRHTASGYTEWEMTTATHRAPATATALVLCDVWDRHWCRSANERLAPLLPGMHHLASTLRAAGALIVHAPSETMDAYAGTPARQRAIEAAQIDMPAPLPHDDPPLPVDAADQFCDTPPDSFYKAWTRQHPAIAIDQERDAISDDGAEHFSLYRQRGIATVLIMGMHANMCVLNRSFAIKALVRQGFDVALVRDLTDAMYNPARSPYVTHDMGTQLVVAYIEKFWCATISSAEILGALHPADDPS